MDGARIVIADVDPDWHAANPDHESIPADDPRRAPDPKDTAGNLRPATPVDGDGKSIMPVVLFGDIKPRLESNDFIGGLLGTASSIVVYGESNSGKTFWTLDAALHVAAGLPWNRRRVEQGGVLYCILEGTRGFDNRVAAWREQHKAELPADFRVPFGAIPVAMDLRDPDADTAALIRTIKHTAKLMGAPVKLVVVDTLSRALAGGNENDSVEMGCLVKCIDLIRAATGAAVLLVHHSGKDAAKGARGHSLLRAAIDTEIEVKATEGGQRTATVCKQRELETGATFAFRLAPAVLGQNEHGEDVTTCTVAPDGSPVKATGKPLSESLAGWLRDIQNLFAAPGTVERVPIEGMRARHTRTRDEIRVCLRENGRFECDARGNLTAKDRGKLRDTLNQLKDKGKLGMTDELVWLL